MRVIVCGSRDWTQYGPIYRALYALKASGQDVEVWHGAARGADTIAAEAATACGFTVHAVPVTREEWKRKGRAAGPIRNEHMLDLARPDLVIACAVDLALSRGTADMIRRAERRGIPIRRVRPDA